MKGIAVFANKKEYAVYIAKNLEIYFADVARFYCYDTGELDSMPEIKEDIVIMSAFTIYQKVKKKVAHNTRLLTVERTIRKDMLNQLRELPLGTRALLVNIDYKNCLEVIAMIYSAGLRSLDLLPYYPGCGFDKEQEKDVKLAITLGEKELVPDFISTVLDFGERAISIESIYLIDKTLGVRNPLSSKAATKEAGSLVSLNLENANLLNEQHALISRLNSVMKIIAKGIIITDITGRIYAINELACDIIGVDESAVGFNITEILPQIRYDEQYVIKNRMGDQTEDFSVEDLIRIHDRNVSISISMTSGDIDGRIIVLEYFNEVENRQHKFRQKITGISHKAVYSFERILGKSEKINQCKMIAKRLAKKDSNIF